MPDEQPATQVCDRCGHERTLADGHDYNALQPLMGLPLGWYSGDDGELCGECMTALLNWGR